MSQKSFSQDYLIKTVQNKTEHTMSYCKHSQGPPACIYGNHRQRIKSLKMVVETSDKNQLSYFYVLNRP